MTIQSVLEELVYRITKQPRSFTPNCDKKINQATAKLKALMLECLPEELEYPCCKNGCGCRICNQIEMHNKLLTDIKQKVDKL